MNLFLKFNKKKIKIILQIYPLNENTIVILKSHLFVKETYCESRCRGLCKTHGKKSVKQNLFIYL